MKPVSDFKAVTGYRTLDNMEYEQLSPEGRIARGQIMRELVMQRVAAGSAGEPG